MESCFLTLLRPATVITQSFALLTEVLGMFFRLIWYIKSVWLVQRSLFVWVHVDVTLNALLPCVGPAVSTHPFALAQWTFQFSKTPLIPLIWSQSLAFWSRLKHESRYEKVCLRLPSSCAGRFLAGHFTIEKMKWLFFVHQKCTCPHWHKPGAHWIWKARHTNCLISFAFSNSQVMVQF